MTSTIEPARPAAGAAPVDGAPGPTSRLRHWVGAATVVLAWIPAVAAAMLLDARDPDWDRPLRVIVVALVFAPVAAVMVTRRRPAVALILGALAVQSGWLALLVALRSSASTGDVELAAALEAVLVWPRVPEVAALAVLPWLLSTRRTLRRSVGIALGIGAVAFDAVVATAIVASGTPIPGGVLVSQVASLVLFVAAAATLAGEWRREPGPRRDALAWLGLGAALLVCSAIPIVLDLPDPAATLGTAAFVLASGVLPSAILAVVLGAEIGADRRLFTVTVWMQAIAVALSLYLVVREAGLLLGLDPTLAGALAAGALALAFPPVTRLLRHRTERMAAGGAAGTGELLRSLGDHLAAAPDPAAGLQGLADALRTAWTLDSVTIRSASNGWVVHVGDPGPARFTVDLFAGGRRVGEIEVGSRHPDALRASVRPALEEVAGLIAVAVLLADLNHDVAETRRRMLGVRHEERQLLHRELHDELAPSIAGLGFGIAAARRLVRAGSPGAVDAVAALRADVAERAEEVRRLARALLPTALDEGDLDAALRELAQRSSADGSPMTVHSVGADILDDRTQLAVYLLAAEAVRDRRDRADRSDLAMAVRLAERAVVLRFTSGDPDPGQSHRRLVDRATELGAIVRTDAAARPPVVEVEVPR
ncbi:MAG TPA: histidine kinase [Agromyces sp.]